MNRPPLLLNEVRYRIQAKDKATDLIAEHLDDIHYVNDILCLNIDSLNEVLTEQLIRRLFLPLYLGSLVPTVQVFSFKYSRCLIS